MSTRGKKAPSGPQAGPVRHIDPATVDLSHLTDDAQVLVPGQHIFDHWGDLWVVQKSRQTNHDFEIYLGVPAVATGGPG